MTHQEISGTFAVMYWKIVTLNYVEITVLPNVILGIKSYEILLINIDIVYETHIYIYI